MSSAELDFLKARRTDAGAKLGHAVILGSVGGFLVIAQAWLLAQVVNAVIFQDAQLAQVIPWLWAMLGIIVLRALVVYASEQVAFNATTRIKHNLRQQLYHKIQRLGPLYLSDERSGEIATTLTDGVEALENYYARYLPAMSLAAWIPLSILAFVLPIDWKSALVFVVTAPLIPLFMVFIGRGAEKLNQQQWRKLTRLGGHFLDVIQGLSTLRLFNASRREAKVIERVSEDYRQSTMKVLRLAFLSSLALEFLATVSIALVAVTVGFRLLYGEMDFLYGFFVLLLAPEFYLPLRSLGTHYHARMEAIGASEKIVQILNQPNPIWKQGQRQLEDELFSIELKGVHVDYASRKALQGLDLIIQPGERLALVGPSGAGKTTLVNLLLGFVQPSTGQLLINGMDLSQYDVESWRRQIAWVPQKPRLFHGSVAHNLMLGLDDVETTQIWQALEMAQADQFVLQLPQGLDTLVGEGGQGISGGQLQRLALARALLRNAKILILDEPTAHLDQDNEKLIRQAMQSLPRDMTVISIAHRLNTIQDSDRIAVLNEGKVVQLGNHESLMGQTGLYRQLVTAQEVVA